MGILVSRVLGRVNNKRLVMIANLCTILSTASTVEVLPNIPKHYGSCLGLKDKKIMVEAKAGPETLQPLKERGISVFHRNEVTPADPPEPTKKSHLPLEVQCRLLYCHLNLQVPVSKILGTSIQMVRFESLFTTNSTMNMSVKLHSYISNYNMTCIQ